MEFSGYSDRQEDSLRQKMATGIRVWDRIPSSAKILQLDRLTPGGVGLAVDFASRGYRVLVVAENRPLYWRLLEISSELTSHPCLRVVSLDMDAHELEWCQAHDAQVVFHFPRLDSSSSAREASPQVIHVEVVGKKSNRVRAILVEGATNGLHAREILQRELAQNPDGNTYYAGFLLEWSLTPRAGNSPSWDLVFKRICEWAGELSRPTEQNLLNAKKYLMDGFKAEGRGPDGFKDEPLEQSSTGRALNHGIKIGAS